MRVNKKSAASDVSAHDATRIWGPRFALLVGMFCGRGRPGGGGSVAVDILWYATTNCHEREAQSVLSVRVPGIYTRGAVPCSSVLLQWMLCLCYPCEFSRFLNCCAPPLPRGRVMRWVVERWRKFPSYTKQRSYGKLISSKADHPILIDASVGFARCVFSRTSGSDCGRHCRFMR